MLLAPSGQTSRLRVAAGKLLRPSVLELVVMALLALAYNVIRGGQGNDVSAAFKHAADIVSWEGWIFDHLEVPVSEWTAGLAIVAVPACYFYAIVHYVATPSVLFLSWKAGGWSYRRGYWSLVLASGLALILYAKYPVAPPRLVPGDSVIDVMRLYSDWGWWGGAASAPRGIGDATNQYAAFPSLHCGWAMWCALQMKDFRAPIWKVLAVAYPLAQAFVVIATGNHYLLDVVAGIGLVLAAHYLVDWVGRRYSQAGAGTSRVVGEPAVRVES